MAPLTLLAKARAGDYGCCYGIAQSDVAAVEESVMHADAEELRKQRIIQFCPFHPDPDQAQSATIWLRSVEGVETVHYLSPYVLDVVYDLQRVTLQGIEYALGELGYHLDNSLLCKLKRALFHYTEETQRENLAIETDCQLNRREVFVNRYQHVAHGCRDPQPEYWREYR